MVLHAFQIWLLAVAGTGLCAWWLAVRSGASLRTIASPVCLLIFVMTVMLAVLAVRSQSPAPPGPRQALTEQALVMGPWAMGRPARPFMPAGETSRNLP